MNRTKIVKVKNDSFKLMIPTMRTSIIIESQIASLTRGTLGILALSNSDESKATIVKVKKLARLDACCIHQKQDAQGNLQDDFNFSFFDLDEVEGQPLVDALSKELDSFIEQFRTASNGDK